MQTSCDEWRVTSRAFGTSPAKVLRSDLKHEYSFKKEPPVNLACAVFTGGDIFFGAETKNWIRYYSLRNSAQVKILQILIQQ